MRRMMVACLVAGAFPALTSAQRLVMRGELRDSVTAAPVAGVTVCYAPNGPNYSRCHRADSAGRFEIDSVSPDPGDIVVACMLLAGGEQTLLRRPTHDPPREPLRLTVASGGCDTRVERRVRGIFAGHFSPGFEQSEFVPCLRASWHIATDTIEKFPFRRSAWVAWPRKGDPPGTPTKWPTPKRVHPPWNYPQYYLRFAGTITGPGSYGHLGVAGFLAEIDSIIEVRTPAAPDCGRLP